MYISKFVTIHFDATKWLQFNTSLKIYQQRNKNKIIFVTNETETKSTAFNHLLTTIWLLIGGLFKLYRRFNLEVIRKIKQVPKRF